MGSDAVSRVAPAPAADAAAIVDVTGLVKRYPGRPVNAVDGITFRVARGEVFGLLGPNGAGKSTTLGVLTTRVSPTAGTARIGGRDVARDTVGVKRLIAVVPQRNNLDRSLSARQNLTFHAAYHGLGPAARRDAADRQLETFGLLNRADERVDRYSGGMAQRLMIARALMHAPAVLFLDEPTTGLDPQSRLFLWDRIRELNARGLTVLITTHDMDEAESLCQKVAIIDHGRLLAMDTPDRLKQVVPGARTLEVHLLLPSLAPPGRSAFVADLVSRLAALPGVEGAEALSDAGAGGPPQGFGTGPQGPWVVPGGAAAAGPSEVSLRLYTAPGPSPIGPAAQVVTASGAELRDLKAARVSLEDVFIHFTGRAMR